MCRKISVMKISWKFQRGRRGKRRQFFKKKCQQHKKNKQKMISSVYGYKERPFFRKSKFFIIENLGSRWNRTLSTTYLLSVIMRPLQAILLLKILNVFCCCFFYTRNKCIYIGCNCPLKKISFVFIAFVYRTRFSLVLWCYAV